MFKNQEPWQELQVTDSFTLQELLEEQMEDTFLDV